MYIYIYIYAHIVYKRKHNATSKSPVGDISVVTLMRTDTTLNRSQEAEKVCVTVRVCLREQTPHTYHRMVLVEGKHWEERIDFRR